MEQRFVDNISEYIEFIETRISKIKLSGRRTFAEFEVKFSSDNIAENLKRYFRSKGYNTEIQKCKLGFFDVIISWDSDES